MFKFAKRALLWVNNTFPFFFLLIHFGLCSEHKEPLYIYLMEVKNNNDGDDKYI